jgi:UPF0755 protein
MNSASSPASHGRIRLAYILVCIPLLGMTALGGVFLYENAPPKDFPVGEHIHVPTGSSLNDISHILARHHIVRSGLLFRSIVTLYGREGSLQAGSYIFHEPADTGVVARSFVDQTSRVPPLRVTIPEGSTLADFDTLLADALPQIDRGDILRATEKEGVLFPDTYHLSEDTSAEEVVALLSETFTQKLKPYIEKFQGGVLSLHNAVILASIVEKEGKDAESMKMVAGILRTRLQKNMPLQTDATLTYLLGKTSAQLTIDDLMLDSPYNTYRNRGLPPTPINSPGLVAIDAVLNPTPSDYLYYLTDGTGVFHYAKTFEEHKRNKILYLK